MKRTPNISILLFTIGLLASDIAMAVPVVVPTGAIVHHSGGTKFINVQGKLTDSTGKVLSGPVTVLFRLYMNSDDPVANAVWTETQVVTIANGVLNVALGSVTALDPLPFNKPYYLGMQVAGDSNELQPRQALGASAYALGSLSDFTVNRDLTVIGNIISSGTLSVKGNVAGNAAISASSMTVNGVDVASNLIPPGAILMFASSCPSGWAPFASLNGKFPVGTLPGTSNPNGLNTGASGGSLSHAHSISTDGKHSHNIPALGLNSATQGNGPTCMYTINCPSWIPYYPGGATGSDGAHSHGGATGAASTLPPYLGVVYCQKL